MVTPIPSEESEETLVRSANKAVSEERPTLRLQSTQTRSSARLGDVVWKQIESRPALIDRAVVRLFDDAGGAMYSSADTDVMSLIRAVVNQSVPRGFLELSLPSCRGKTRAEVSNGTMRLHWRGDSHGLQPCVYGFNSNICRMRGREAPPSRRRNRSTPKRFLQSSCGSKDKSGWRGSASDEGFGEVFMSREG